MWRHERKTGKSHYLAICKHFDAPLTCLRLVKNTSVFGYIQNTSQSIAIDAPMHISLSMCWVSIIKASPWDLLFVVGLLKILLVGNAVIGLDLRPSPSFHRPPTPISYFRDSPPHSPSTSALPPSPSPSPVMRCSLCGWSTQW